MVKKVVVIDDEAIQRRGLVSTTPWRQYNCEVIGEADTVEDALQLIRATSPHIVITDIRMPGMSGLELIEILKEETDCEFIIISGYSEFAYAKEAVQLGVVHYLLKPVGDDELLEALGNAVARIEEKEKIQKLKRELSTTRGKQTATDSIFQNYGEGKSLHKYLDKALQYIGENCHQNLTVQDVASHLHISSSYFFKLFSSQMPCTFNDYLTECRVRKAIQLLGNESLKIYEIAEACGYKDTRYFSNVFRKVVGITPTEYRSGK